MSTISTHVLDTAIGRPAAGIAVALDRLDEFGAASPVGAGATDADGRVRDLLAAGARLEPGTYRLRFETGPYLAAGGGVPFYPRVTVEFVVSADVSHHHIPLLLSPYGYSTYRGS